MSNDVPPKNIENCCVLVKPKPNTIAGRMAIKARNIDPGNVILDNITSRNSAVALPGLTPGIKLPCRLRSSAIWFGFTVIAV
jgi:hypothetical protein